jgi:hypothetical protein
VSTWTWSFAFIVDEGHHFIAAGRLAMRIIGCLLLCVCATVNASAQVTTSVTVLDNSPSWTPVQISGTINVTEQVIGKAVSSSSEYELQGQNTSSKEIVLLSVYFEEASSSVGAGTSHSIEIDRLFSPIKPGESLVLDRSVCRPTNSHCCINPLSPRGEPINLLKIWSRRADLNR